MRREDCGVNLTEGHACVLLGMKGRLQAAEARDHHRIHSSRGHLFF